MPEGLSAPEVGKEIAEHAERKRENDAQERRDRLVDRRGRPVVGRRSDGGLVGLRGGEVEHRVPRGPGRGLDRRTKANRANLQAIEVRNFDSSTFEASFSAYTGHNKQAMALAEHRFRPAFRVAFDAWRARSPRRIPTRLGVRPTCRSTDSRSSGRRRRLTRRRMRRSPQARARARPPTNTSRHRLPRERPLSGRHQHANSRVGAAIRACRAWRCATRRLLCAAHAAAGPAHLAHPAESLSMPVAGPVQSQAELVAL